MTIKMKIKSGSQSPDRIPEHWNTVSQTPKVNFCTKPSLFLFLRVVAEYRPAAAAASLSKRASSSGQHPAAAEFRHPGAHWQAVLAHVLSSPKRQKRQKTRPFTRGGETEREKSRQVGMCEHAAAIA